MPTITFYCWWRQHCRNVLVLFQVPQCWILHFFYVTIINTAHDTYWLIYENTLINRWLGLRLDFIGNCAILFAALFATITRDKLESGLAGLSIVYALQVSNTFQLYSVTCLNLSIQSSPSRLANWYIVDFPLTRPAWVYRHQCKRYWQHVEEMIRFHNFENISTGLKRLDIVN